MRTIPASWGTLIYGDSTPVWLVRIDLGKSIERYATLQMDIDEGLGAVTYAGGRIQKIGKITYSADVQFGGVARIADARIELTNQDGALSADAYNGATVDVYLTFLGLTSPTLANDCLKIFHGVVTDVQETKDRTIVLKVESAWKVRHREINQRLVDFTNANNSPTGNPMYPPPENEEEKLPVIYGKVWVKIPSATGEYSPPEFVWVACDHEVKQVRRLRYEDANGDFQPTTGTRYTTPYGAVVKAVGSPDAGMKQTIEVLYAPDVDTENVPTGWSNIGNMVDEDIGTYAQYYRSTDPGYWDACPLLFQNPPRKLPLYPMVEVAASIDVFSSIQKIRFREREGTTDTWTSREIAAEYYNSLPAGYGGQGSAGSDARLQIGKRLLSTFQSRNYYIDGRRGTGTSTVPAKVWEVVFVLSYLLVVPLWAEIWGYPYGAWARGSHVQGALIEHPVGIIESILRDRLSVTEIDTSAFDLTESTVGTLRFGSAFVGESLDAIREICRQAGLLYCENAGVERVVPLRQWTSVRTLQEKEIWRERVSYQKTRTIYNQVYVKWGWDPILEDWMGVKYVTESGHNFSNATEGSTYQQKCSDSQSTYGVTRKIEVEGTWIRDEASAEALVKHIVDLMADRRKVAEVEGTLGLIDIELGDQVEFPTSWGLGRFYVRGVEIIPLEATVRLTLEELPAVGGIAGK